MRSILRKVWLLALIASAVTAAAVTVTLQWRPSPSGDEVAGYIVYQSTNVAGPFAPVAHVTGTNAFLDLAPGRYFFYVTATNFWTESPPSNTISTPPAPSKVDGVKVTK
jgi:hypothetical protein